MVAHTPPSREITVVVADDHAVVRVGVRLLLERENGLRVAGEATTVERAEELVRLRRPSVLVLDLQMPGDALAAMARLCVGAPALGLVVFTMRDDVRTARAALAAGAGAYVVKDAPGDTLPAAVRAVAAGGRYLDPRIGAQLLDEDTTPGGDGLSDREREVLRLVAFGHTHPEIAGLLHLSVRTVEAHRAHLQRKLGTDTRHELVVHALRRGLLAGD